MTIEYTKRARADLVRFPPDISRRILQKMSWFAQQDDPLSFAKRLRNSARGTYRFRIGEYRAVCDVSGDALHILHVLSIKHRKEVYRDI